MEDHELKTIDDLLNGYRRRIRQLEDEKKELELEIEESEKEKAEEENHYKTFFQ